MSDLMEIEMNEEKAIEILTGTGMDEFLNLLRDNTLSIDYDTTTEEGRKAIKSRAHNIAKLKTKIDGYGKNLVSEWKAKAKVVDGARSKVKNFLDLLKIEVRQPVDEWEKLEAEKEKAIKEAEDKKIREEKAEELRLLKEREAEIERKEKEIKEAQEALELEARNKAVEATRIEREAEIAKATEERVEKEAAEKILKAERDLVEAKELADKVALKVEEDKKQAVQDAIDKQAKENKDKLRAEQEEAQRSLDEEIEKKRIRKIKEDEHSRNLEHRRQVNNNILQDLVANGVESELAKNIIILIASNKIRNLTINY